ANTTEDGIFNCTGNNPFQGIPAIGKFWKNPNNHFRDWWKAPDGLFWICGKRAYSRLPKNWKGSCTLGVIQPGFFLLPMIEGNHLGVPV
ncbi:ENR1 protein, partial [Baryphthengus martii]|nr:ENR1 protein [Baryphthengus martii]